MKLVRDRIPEIIEKSGKVAEISLLSPEELDKALDEKLREEAKECIESHAAEEMADVLEVLHAIAERRGILWNEVERERVKKREERGGFEQGVLLCAVREDG